MSIVIVGGHECMECHYKKICKKHGYKPKVFTHLPANFHQAIGTPEAIVILSKTVSHKMVKVAVSKAKKYNIPCIRCQNSSINTVENTIKKFVCATYAEAQ